MPPRLALAALLALLAPGIASAQGSAQEAAPAARAAVSDEPITLADDPFQITDPRPTPPGEASFAVVGAYDRAPTGRVRDTFGLEATQSVGVAPNLDIRFGQTGAYGNLDIRRRLGTLGASAGEGGSSEEGGRAELGGTARIGALYQLNREGGGLPNIGVVGRLRGLYGPGQPAYEAETALLLGKTLIGGALPLGASFNLGLVQRFDPRGDERATRYLVNASLGQAISRDTALVVTYAREQQERGDEDFSLIQVGVRHRLRDRGAILGVAAGFGLNRDSPAFQLAVGAQWELGARP